MRNDNVVIKTERLRKTFGEIVAVDNVSIEIFRGEIFGLVGPNGAGKTTLIRLLNGLLIPDLRKKFWDYFRQLVESGKTIIITTHYLEEAKYCDRIGMMYRGRIISLGSLSEILSRVSFGWRLRVTTEKKINQEIIDEITSSFNVKLEAIRDREIILRYDNGSVIDDLILFFNKRNLVVEDVETIPPSLSDMFIHFIKKEFFEGEVS